ncbi:helix-turn-helix domain-containing protein, partial [Neglectibacter timonensis]
MVKNLRSLRESRGLSQEKLAELTGISKARIYT